MATTFIPCISRTKSLMVSDAGALLCIEVLVGSLSRSYCLYIACFHGICRNLTALGALLLFSPPADQVGWTELECAEVVTEG